MAFIFDLDGVLIDCKSTHEESFLLAWNEVTPEHPIDNAFHNSFLEGRNTLSKIRILEERFNLKSSETQIFELKQKYTIEHLERFQYPTKFVNIMQELKSMGFKLGCATNSIRKTVDLVLTRLKIYDMFDVVLSNQDVDVAKPSPNIYIKAMQILGVNPSETFIVEDSEVGLKAARDSLANVIRVIDSVDVTMEFLKKSITSKRVYEPWNDPNWKLRVVIPMAGDGIRFKNAGYTVTKPLIMVADKFMIDWVISNVKSKNPLLQEKIEYHLCVRKEFVSTIKSADNVHIHPISSLTEGPACTVLTLRDILKSDNNPLLIANSDQYLEWEFDDFLQASLNPHYLGCISTFHQPNPADIKWSYANQNLDGIVTEVAEKRYIGPSASTGIYFWRSGVDFLRYTDEMIGKNDRVNNEFYVTPVYNYAINDGARIRTFKCKKLWGLGVPEDLRRFQREFLHINDDIV